MPLRRRRQHSVDIWPGFVDALGNLLIILIFVLMVFVIAQFFLGQTLSGREEALSRITRQMSEMVEQLNMEKSANADLRRSVASLSSQLSDASVRIEALSAQERQATEASARLNDDIAALRALKEKLEREISEKDRMLADQTGRLNEQTQISEQERAQAALLREQLAGLQQEMARLASSLDAAEKVNQDQKAQISDLGRQLNRALATKVQELQRYRSEFFGRLREVLGNRTDIRIEGDRFVFQSEVLFDTGSAELRPEGQQRLVTLADTLAQISKTIPNDIDWILRIDGHTDKRPINTVLFRSNWDLSAARAISVVNFLSAHGIPPQRLAAAGFGEYQPLVPGTDDASMAKNRRIEMKFDQR